MSDRTPSNGAERTVRRASAVGALRALGGFALAAPLALAPVPARLQEGAAPPTSSTAQNADGGAPSAAPDATQGKLRALEGDLGAAEAARRKLEADVEGIRGDRARLSAALIEATSRVQGAEARIGGLEARLETLTGSESALKASLESHRTVVGEVLAALQRIGRKPLPALLVRPEDMLLAIRTSMLLGAVVPELRDKVEALASDLAELSRVRAAIGADRDTLSQELGAMRAERERLAALVAAREAAQAQAETSLESEKAHAAALAREAATLRDLIARTESDDSHRSAASGGAGADRLAPAVSFASARGSLSMPASGAVIRRFGATDGFGSTERGLSLATRPEAVVSTPADGWVSFSGPYRSYGQLLIINTGGGYFIVLAGMARTNVGIGQFVLAGEPVGVMGDGSRRTATAVALGAAQPILYVEFRKDGAAIDPGPWWAKGEMEKVRG